MQLNIRLNVNFYELKSNEKPPYPLPNAATCSSTLDVPLYPTKEIMLERIRVAIREGSDMILDEAMNASLRAE